MAESQVTVAASPSWQDTRSGSRHERGYGTEWDKIRIPILERDRHVCQCPDCMGGEKRLRPATHVDHIISKAQWRIEHGSLEGVDNPSNLRAMNKDCHKAKTQRDQAAAYGRGGRKP